VPVAVFRDPDSAARFNLTYDDEETEKMADLVALATAYIEAAGKLEETKTALKAALMNGAGDAAASPSSVARSRRPGRAKKAASLRARWAQTASGERSRVLERSAEMDEKVLALLKVKPMKNAEIAKAVICPATTTSFRMKRLEGRGLVRREESGAWAALA
jgi:uncharacterized membrane protein